MAKPYMQYLHDHFKALLQLGEQGANMDSDAGAILKPIDHAIHQLSRPRQFLTRITAGCKGRSHESAAFVGAAMDHFGKNRFIKLNELHIFGDQVLQFITQQLNNIVGHDGFVAINAFGK